MTPATATGAAPEIAPATAPPADSPATSAPAAVPEQKVAPASVVAPAEIVFRPTPAERREARHVESVIAYCTPPPKPDLAARGMERQEGDRRRERDVRKRAVAFGRCLGRSDQAADHLELDPELVRRWRREWEDDKLTPEPLGRPPQRSSWDKRTTILFTLHSLGPRPGVPVLEGLFPGVARRELESILARFRKQWHDPNGRIPHELVWTRPGAVWATDYSDPDTADPIDDFYHDIFLARDLASYRQLDAFPVPRESAKRTAALMDRLFRLHGPPLVVKQDNGGTVLGAEVRKVFDSWGVHWLPSPPYMPQYNGSCEAGNGSIKVRAAHVAMRHGRRRYWTCDDLLEALQLANATARPWGPQGPVPNQVFDVRQPISDPERKAFDKVVRQGLDDLRAKQSLNASSPAAPKSAHEAEMKERTLMRRAVRQALEAGGYLRYRRSGLPQLYPVAVGQHH